jgi:hypothetical protein
MDVSAQPAINAKKLRRLALLAIKRADQEFEDYRGDVIDRQAILVERMLLRAKDHFGDSVDLNECSVCREFFAAANEMLQILQQPLEATVVAKRELIHPMWNFLLASKSPTSE